MRKDVLILRQTHGIFSMSYNCYYSDVLVPVQNLKEK